MDRYVRPDELLAYAIGRTRAGLRDAQRPSGTQKRGLVRAVDELIERVDEIEPGAGTPVPAPVGVLTLVSNVGGWSVAGPSAAVTVSWPAVTVDVEGEPLTVTYELFADGMPALMVSAAQATVQIPSGVERALRVRAVSEHGVPGDLSPERTVTGAEPVVVTRAPSAPVLTSGAGNAFARWDGTYISGGTAGAHTVRVEARLGSGVWQMQGTLTAAGEQLVRVGAIGDTVAVRFLAYDQLGRLTGTSEVKTVVVVGIDLGDLDQEIQDALESIGDLSEAVTLEGGRLTWSADAPLAADAAGKPLGATWFRRDGAGAVIGQWELTALGWVPRPFSETIIPKVAIGSGTYGDLDGVRMKARSVMVEKLLVGSFDNLIPNPALTGVKTDGWSTVTGGMDRWSYRNTTGLPGVVLQGVANGFEARIKADNTVAAKPGQKFALGVRVFLEAYVGTPPAYGLVFRDAAGGWVASSMVTMPGTVGGFNDFNTVIEVPNTASIVSANWEILIPAGATAGNVLFGKPMWREAVTGKMLVDGSVEARHVLMDEGYANKFWANEANVGKIRVDHVEPNFGDNLNLSANGNITLIAGRQDEQDSAIAAAQDAADRAGVNADNAQATGNNAAELARIAEGKALVAQIHAQDAGEKIAAQNVYFRVTGSGAEVGELGGSSATRVVPEGVELVSSGTIAAELKQGRLIVPEAIVARAQLGGHVAERSGIRTTFRPI